VVERVEPQASADESTTLAEFLDYYRATMLIKAEGLTDDQARTPATPPSTLNLMGLVRHMADVERNWYRRVFSGESRETTPPIFYTDDDTELDMRPPPGATLADAVAALEAEIEIARQIASDVPLDQSAAVERHGERPNLRWIMVHMIEEYARHCGHADLLREAIDGQTGD
jgi:Protein of unknown function (DUF664)